MTRAALAIALLALPAAAEEPRNLVVNGGFEESSGGWQRPDGLTSFREKDGQSGGWCMRFDTDVKMTESRARRTEMEQPDPPPAKPKSPTKHPDYSTAAGGDGVPFYTDYIEIKPGMRYTLSMDARAEKAGMTPKVFLKGYSEDDDEVLDDSGARVKQKFRRVHYKVYKDCACDADWKAFSITVCPTIDSPDIRWVRVMLFPYWPQGIYWFDNVSLVEAGPEPGIEDRWKAKGAGRVAEQKRLAQADVTSAKLAIKVTSQAIQTYKLDTGHYPETLAALWEQPEGEQNWGGPYMVELDVDPWGAPYRYSVPGKRHPAEFDLESPGPDGVPGGGDDVEN